ncbi:hypothetical protein HHL23_07540 [Chryseobacterium sp. RP-3-3]|uniref:Uncharacterized protein n=1 Tax=Chryseobacterium antibioticum TaxID=2728847 RepID=A0A7Y0FRH4_9FLAO|nr:hypothetical protein [Chryseobacterium antibioticum]NML69646.1 hypothetical protein [Chryseobacterium antibioticum]
MSLSKSLFGENIPLLQLESFSQPYTLTVENTFLMGKENPPISLKTTSDIVLKQDKDDNFLYNTIELLHITGDTEDHIMKPFLMQSLALSDISRSLFIKRNLDGKMLSVEKKEDLWKDWELWKQNKLSSVFPEEKDQIKMISNYEKGLKDFDTGLKKNLQYVLLLPEIYSLIFPPNEHFSFLSSQLQFNSRLVDGMEYNYQMKLVKLDEEKDTLSVELHSILNNKDELIKSHLKKLYEDKPDFSVDNFEFSIKVKYSFEKSSSKINNAELHFTEKLHDHLAYFVDMRLEIRD